MDRAPTLDGTLDDPLWQSADPLDDFLQRNPDEGQPATEKTVVRILYTRREVYFGIHCYDSLPPKIVASELRRDIPQDLDDHFDILIDSRHDKRNGYVFEFNPLGTQTDGLITEEGSNQSFGSGNSFDRGWDGIWTSATRMTSDGWTATIAIPFSTLNFTKSENVVWGVNFKRFIRRKNEEDIWAAWHRTWGIVKVSEAGELQGITDIDSGRLFIIKPYGLTGAEQQTRQDWHALYTGGVDVKYGLRSNMVANLTVNTDFADSDVDTQQFNLTPYKIFIPEKRPFFLENAGIFDFSTGGSDRMFFSRQIGIDPVSGQQVPINFGGKLTGQVGKFGLGVLDVQTRASGLNPSANYAAVRVTRTLFGDSYIGAMYIDKRSGHPLDSYNQSAGFDMRLIFMKSLSIFIWGATTRTPGLVGNDTDAGFFATYDTNLFHWIGAVDKIARNYNPEVGFLPHVDVKENLQDVRFSPRPKIPHVRELDFEVFFYRAPNTANILQINQLAFNNSAQFHNGSFIEIDPYNINIQRLNTPFNIYKDVNIPVGIYRFVRHHLGAGSPQYWPLTFNGYDEFGEYYGGHLNTLYLTANYRPTRRLSFSLGQTWNRFRMPEGNFSVVLASFQTNYSFSRFLSFTSLVQLNTANTQALSANFRLRYNYRPDSDLYVIYNVGTQFESLNGSNQQQLRDSRLSIKFTYSFQPELGRRKNSEPAGEGAPASPDHAAPNSASNMLQRDPYCTSYPSPAAPLGSAPIISAPMVSSRMSSTPLASTSLAGSALGPMPVNSTPDEFADGSRCSW